MLTLGLAAFPALPRPGPAPDALSLSRDTGLAPDPAAAAGPDELPANTGLFGRIPPLASALLPGDAAPLMLLLLGSGLMLGPALSAAAPVPAPAAVVPVALRACPSSTCAALLAKLSELRLSPQEAASGDRLQTSSTLLLPHRLSCSTCMHTRQHMGHHGMARTGGV